LKRIIVFGIVAMAAVAGQANAQNCATATTAGLTAGQIKTLVSNKYACANLSATEHWNELHNSSTLSGNVLDYKKGPTDPIDPSDTAGHPTGQYKIAIGPGGVQGPGTVTYTYGSLVYSYYIVNNMGAPLYSFCGASGGSPQLAVTVQAGHC
jgi:hypothetical protein